MIADFVVVGAKGAAMILVGMVGAAP